MRFLSRETRGRVGEGRRAVPGSWKEPTTERCLLRGLWSLPKRDDAVHLPGQTCGKRQGLLREDGR